MNIVEDDDDESSDEEGMTPQDTDEEDELSQAQSSGGRQNAEYVCFNLARMYNSGVSPFPRRFPSRGPQTPKLVRAPEGAPTKPTVQPVVQKYVILLLYSRAAV